VVILRRCVLFMPYMSAVWVYVIRFISEMIYMAGQLTVGWTTLLMVHT